MEKRIDTSKYDGHVSPPYVVNEIETFTQNFGGELDNKRTYFREYTIDAPNRKGLKELVRTGIKDYHEKRLKGGQTHSKELVEPYDRPYLSFTNEAEATARLMADAPEILAELKRCYEKIDKMDEAILSARELLMSYYDAVTLSDDEAAQEILDVVKELRKASE